MTAGTPHRREKLAGTLWPDSSEENARKNLRQDAEQLVLWTKIANIALMPLLVALAGLAVALVRRRRQAAA